MIKRETGFTLIELLITIFILGFVLAATSDTFVGLLRSYKQQSKITETNIEGIVGLELLRLDIERAGYGLPWVLSAGVNYSEATQAGASGYNDSPSTPPRPILSDNNYSSGLPFFGLQIKTNNGYDYADLLVIKATSIPRSGSSQLWTYMMTNGPKIWTPNSENLNAATDYVIVLSPGTGSADARTFVYARLYGNVANPAPQDPQPQFVYGIGPNPPSMPFNRADYYITRTNVDVPQRCAQNTGVLVKSLISQSNGQRTDYLPLLDCVADMKVIFRLDTLGNGTLTPYDQLVLTGTPMTAQQIRTMVKEVRVYILAHEGQRDPNYTYPTSTIYVGDNNPLMDNGLGHQFNIQTNVNYRWKLYTIIVQPKNLGQ